MTLYSKCNLHLFIITRIRLVCICNCIQAILTSVLQDTDAWRNHAIRDITHDVCILPVSNIRYEITSKIRIVDQNRTNNVNKIQFSSTNDSKECIKFEKGKKKEKVRSNCSNLSQIPRGVVNSSIIIRSIHSRIVSFLQAVRTHAIPQLRCKITGTSLWRGVAMKSNSTTSHTDDIN